MLETSILPVISLVLESDSSTNSATIYSIQHPTTFKSCCDKLPYSLLIAPSLSKLITLFDTFKYTPLEFSLHHIIALFLRPEGMREKISVLPFCSSALKKYTAKELTILFIVSLELSSKVASAC